MGFKKRYKITQDLLPISKRRSGKKIEHMGFVVAHDTGNPGSTAMQNFNYYKSTDASASAHAFVDDKGILEIIPLTIGTPEKAWHVRYDNPGDNLAFGDDANDIAAGVEFCYGGKIDIKESYRKYVWYIAYIMYKFKLNPVTDLTGHFLLDPQRRSDPILGLRAAGKTWREFHLDIIKEYDLCKNNEPDEEVTVISNAKPLLRNGMKGAQVMFLERRLQVLGFFKEEQYIDTYFGTYTTSAVKEFQQARGLAPDGVVGPKTWTELQKDEDVSKVSSRTLLHKMSGKDVNELEKMLEFLGYNLGKYVDDFFGTITVTAVRKFQADNNLKVDGVAGPITWLQLKNACNERENLSTVEGYHKTKMFDSDVHVYVTSKNESVSVELGKFSILERLSAVSRGAKAKINAGFFDVKSKREHLGMLIRNGLYYYPPSNHFVDFIYFKDGSTKIENYDEDDMDKLENLQKTSHWAIGTSWSLMQEGEINLENSEKIYHSRTRQPRTLFGQTKEGNFILVVVDGRNENSKGVTAEQSAEIAKQLNGWNVVNLDGGGSSEMIVKDKIMNHPSDGGERYIGTFITVK